MAASFSSLQTSDSASSDDFGIFMRNLEEKSSEEIDRNYFSRQKGVVLRKYLVLNGVQTSDLGQAYNKEQLSNLAFEAWKLCLQEISEAVKVRQSLFCLNTIRQIRAVCCWCCPSNRDSQRIFHMLQRLRTQICTTT